MSTAKRARNASLLGALFAIASLLAFPHLLTFFERQDLVVALDAQDVAKGPYIEVSEPAKRQLYIDGTPGNLATPVAPGLHHVSWKEKYLGGHERTVGHTQLVGPFQDPASPPCGVALLIAPSFLDQTAPIVQTLVAEELRGMRQWPLGDFRNVTQTSLEWTLWQDHPPNEFRRAQLEAPLAGQKLHGHLRVRMTIDFENATVPLSLMVVPFVFQENLRFRIFVNAKLELDNRLFQWVANFFDGNDRVSRLIDEQVSRELRNVLDKPPDIPLEDGGTLGIEFCKDRQLQFHAAGHVSMPLALRVASRSPSPPFFPPGEEAVSPAMHTPLAVELDRNALGNVLHTLWSSGLLDRKLIPATLSAFNEHPTVREYLDVRIRSGALHLPPTIDILEASQPLLRVRTSSELVFEDRGRRTQARVFAELDVDERVMTTEIRNLSSAVRVGEFHITCLGNEGFLTPCYGQIVEQLRANREALDEELTTHLRNLLLQLFTRRTLGHSSTQASYALESTSFHVERGRLRASLAGSLR